MTFYCKNCGEEEVFYIKKYFTEYSTEDELIDAEGQNIDYINRETDDTEQTDSDSPRCSKCDENIENYGEEELEIAKANYKQNHKEEIMKKEGVKNWKEIVGEVE